MPDLFRIHSINAPTHGRAYSDDSAEAGRHTQQEKLYGSLMVEWSGLQLHPHLIPLD